MEARLVVLMGHLW